MSFNHRHLVKAGRKVHRCDNCRQPIEKGFPSILASGVHEGDFYSWRSHPECDDLWLKIFKDLDAWDYGMDVDTLEAIGESGQAMVAFLKRYEPEHPRAVEHLMVTVRKWIEEDA